MGLSPISDLILGGHYPSPSSSLGHQNQLKCHLLMALRDCFQATIFLLLGTVVLHLSAPGMFGHVSFEALGDV